MPLIDTLTATAGAAPPHSRPAADAAVIDLATSTVTELNALLQDAPRGDFVVQSPAGLHNLAVGLDTPVNVVIAGHAGYYCGGMNAEATITVTGNAAVGIAENMMSGRVTVRGAAGQAAAASAHGGLLVVRGDAGARCGISMKGVDIVIEGSVGHASGFMAQSGRLLVCGDAGDGLGDSLYEARIYVRGAVTGLGADCVEKEVRAEHLADLEELLAAAGLDDLAPTDFRRYGSARTLYNFTADRITG